jgi:RNA polymerase sigma-70 factor (ECF subfamily)
MDSVSSEPLAFPRRDPAYERARDAAAIDRKRRLEDLVDRHEAKLRGLVFATLQDPDRVDDVVQDTFVRAYRKLPPSFANVRHEAAWLCRIAYRLCLNEFRARGRRREVLGVEHETAGAEPIVDETLRVLAQLPVDQRAAVLLVDLIGLDYESAATALGVPRGTIASRLNAARARLRESFDV